MKRSRDLADQCNKCRHFTGLGNDSKGDRLPDNHEGRGTCRALVKYDDVCKNGARMIAMPCFPMERDNMPADGIWPTCPKQSFKTAAEIAAEVAEIDAHSRIFLERMTVVRPAIFKHAGIVSRASTDDEFYGIKDKYPESRAGSFPCPICKTGMLRYSIAGSNGHIHAHCGTPNCVSWME